MSRAACASLVTATVLLVATVEPAAPQTTAQPFARVHLTPASGATVGERVELAIDLYVPTWFTTPPDLPPLDVPDAFVVPLTTTSRVTEQVGGQIWGGVRYGYAITPQAAGTLEVPAIALTFEYAIDAGPSGPFTVRTTALPLPVRLPPGAEALDYFFAAPALHLSDRFDPHVPARLSIGEAFSRRIALAADDINGLTLPPVDIASPDGLRVSIEPPAMSTTGDEKTGTRVTRTQQVTYIAERPGHYTLPAVSVDYWSTSANAVRSVTLPAVSFDVAAAAAFHEEIALPPDQEVAAASRLGGGPPLASYVTGGALSWVPSQPLPWCQEFDGGSYLSFACASQRPVAAAASRRRTSSARFATLRAAATCGPRMPRRWRGLRACRRWRIGRRSAPWPRGPMRRRCSRRWPASRRRSMGAAVQATGHPARRLCSPASNVPGRRCCGALRYDCLTAAGISCR